MSRIASTSHLFAKAFLRATNRLNAPAQLQPTVVTTSSLSSSQHSWRQTRRIASAVSTATGQTGETDVYTGDIPLEQFLNKKLLAARKSKDAFRTNVLRTVVGELQTELKSKSGKQKEADQNLDVAAVKSLRTAISKRKTAAKEYRESGLESSAETEEQEAAYLSSLLPKELSGEQLSSEVTRLYVEARENGAFEAGGKPTIASILAQTVESLEKVHGKGSIATGEVARILMPLIQKKAENQG